jgi:hypothetical protein
LFRWLTFFSFPFFSLAAFWSTTKTHQDPPRPPKTHQDPLKHTKLRPYIQLEMVACRWRFGIHGLIREMTGKCKWKHWMFGA